MSGYLNGSTINVSYKNNPQRYTGGYVTEDFFRIVRRIARSSAAILPRTTTSRAPRRQRSLATKFGNAISAAIHNIVGQSVRINGKAATIIGVMPQNFKFPQSEELWVPLYNEFPIKPREDARAAGSAPAVMGRLKDGVSLDQANAEFSALAKRIANDNPKTNEHLTAANVQPLLNSFTGPQLRGTVYAMLGAVLLVLGHRVRERDEHAVWPRRLAGEGTGDPRRARCHPLASGSPDADGKFPHRRHGRRCRRSFSQNGALACSSARRTRCPSRCLTG